MGSRRIKSMIASTNDAYCPTLRAITKTALPEGVNSVLEIVINGVDSPAIASAMRLGIDAACRNGVIQISAGNYGGKLGPHHFYLRKIMGWSHAVSGPGRQAKDRLQQRADLSEVWPSRGQRSSPRARWPTYRNLERDGRVTLGDLFDIEAQSSGRIEFTGEWTWPTLGAGLQEGEVLVKGNVGREAGTRHGRRHHRHDGDAGPRAGAAPPATKRGWWWRADVRGSPERRRVRPCSGDSLSSADGRQSDRARHDRRNGDHPGRGGTRHRTLVQTRIGGGPGQDHPPETYAYA